MPSTLTITTTTKPYISSPLALSLSPTSPLPPDSSASMKRTATATGQVIRPDKHVLPSYPPSKPMPWLWQCHMCSRVYALATTRRCLDDGHFFCAGTTTVKRSRGTGKKIVKTKACASEFDYAAWKAWGAWRREVTGVAKVSGDAMEASTPQASMWFGGIWSSRLSAAETRKAEDAAISKISASAGSKDCWNSCNYPSECRWGKLYGVSSPTGTDVSPSSATLPSTPPISPQNPEVGAQHFEDVSMSVPATISEGDESTIDDSLDTHSSTTSMVERKPGDRPIESLLSSVRKQRKSQRTSEFASTNAIEEVPDRSDAVR